jgi:HEAT repeat protein
MSDSDDEWRIGGLQSLQSDSRSTAEVIETALADAERKDDLPENYRAIAVLHARGTRDVLTAALALCGSPDPKRRALGAEILGQLGSPERTFSRGMLRRAPRSRET